MVSDRTSWAGSERSDSRATLVRVAWFYYKDNLTQAQIAAQLSVSRATVARMLERAKDLGIVRIEISADELTALELSRAVRDRYGLTDVVVVPQIGVNRSPEEINEQLGQAGAQYLRRHLRPGAIIGIGWGDTVLRALFALSRDSLKDVTIATIAGGIDAYTRRVLGSSNNDLGTHIRFLPAPLLASAPNIAAALRDELAVTSVLQLAAQADATLIGIGSALSSATILQHGVVNEHQLAEYRTQGAVGDILAEWYDRDGRVVDADFHRLRIGIPIRDLQTMPNVIAVAGGIDKLDAIAGALAGGYLDVLVTTEDVALELTAR
ncbi:sugar-binding transcriptional regulator [Pengzhenrongella sicca]|uniref:Sugar-binding domain-containing protein n=1 Tax=Pengzhenrongella sicca TaxID=2819238 RepID=A0A8A4Z7R2_9MICO|nr:sugar-binding domain-containing protein [Pengzhenrongella sicca]QTE27950.1 hypothetical protein J4E96_11075 [Pengzhenrongella sicca]